MLNLLIFAYLRAFKISCSTELSIKFFIISGLVIFINYTPLVVNLQYILSQPYQPSGICLNMKKAPLRFKTCVVLIFCTLRGTLQ